jgi:general secretion pathway protein A
MPVLRHSHSLTGSRQFVVRHSARNSPVVSERVGKTTAVHESLEQRIVVSYHFAGFARDEVPAYLIHRLKLAGCTLPLFEPPAIEALFQASQGLPRKVNRAAHYALSAAALAKARQVSADHVQTALDEFRP